ncbi:hypothetical protein ABT273_35095 [Streptomyces humidus]|uniref:hypothetical protein n=1 Tax=Streptomyces humidus TaxID=52259 RepID=UPI00332DDB89
MRRTLALAAALTTVLLAGGCVSLPGGAPPQPHLAPDAARTPSPVPDPGQAPAFTALVSTAPSGTPQSPARHRRGAAHRFPGPGDAGHRPPRAQPPARPHSGSKAARPARPARPRQVRPGRPRSTYDLRTVCGWSHRSPVSPSVRRLCDAFAG